MTKPVASNMMRTCEHVSQGHPDKACDQVADTILDEALSAAKNAGEDPSRVRTAIEMLAKDNLLVISGEVRMSPAVAAAVDVAAVARRKWRDIGYPDADSLTILNHLQVQSPELQVSSDNDGAGDQGIMVGYADNRTASFMPKEYELARNLCMRLEELRASGTLPWLRADTKTQVTLSGDGAVARLVIAAQHAAEVEGEKDPKSVQAVIKARLQELAISPIIGSAVDDSKVTVNGSGSFVIGGPIGDAGVVGRKIVVDAYGPAVPVGGGAYSGKDPTKVDRSAAYMARHIAKTAAAMKIGGANTVTVTLAYCIGLHEPEMVTAVTDSGADISDWVRSRFKSMSPRTIAETLGLWRKTGADWRYDQTAKFGHYGRDIFPWENIAAVSD